MNRELIESFLRQRLTSVTRLVLLSLMFFFPIMVVLLIPSSPLGLLAPNATQFALVLSAGMIGQDVSAGVLQLVFARPVRRSEYVFSRWAAAAGAAVWVVIVQLALVTVVAALRGRLHDPGELLLFAAEGALRAIGVVSVMTLFSALVPGLADLAILAMAWFSNGVLGLVGQAAPHAGFLVRISEEIQRFVSPEVALGPLLNGDAISWFAVASYLSTVSLCLALAVVVMNRKELSYATG
jgi:ABC-type transport system involved in multi-copper enzyme maturation permease subunit